jgi:hypothetical protein
VIRSLCLAVILLLGFAFHVWSLGKAADSAKLLPADADQSIALPLPLLKIAVLEFRGLASDIFFLDSMIFIGGTQARTEVPKVKDREWRWWTKTLDAATDLDPYFFDPYYYANAFLSWDAGQPEEANRILKKGSQYRDWDWMLPFYVGFNDFFFLHDDKEAAGFMMEASRRPGGNPIFASIAARLAYKENRTETAIYFLEETVKNTKDVNIKKRFDLRIRGLQSIAYLENAVNRYKKIFGKAPSAIDDLVRKRILDRIPDDPYGGRYFITREGTVRSTASSELEPYLSPLARRTQ